MIVGRFKALPLGATWKLCTHGCLEAYTLARSSSEGCALPVMHLGSLLDPGTLPPIMLKDESSYKSLDTVSIETAYARAGAFGVIGEQSPEPFVRVDVTRARRACNRRANTSSPSDQHRNCVQSSTDMRVRRAVR